MKTIDKNDFSEISLLEKHNIVCLKWFAGSEHMSDWEFMEQIDTFFSAVEVFGAKEIYIDASKFNYLFNEKSIRLIVQYIDACELRTLDIITGASLSGRTHIQKLSNELSSKGLELNIFNSNEEGEIWIAFKTSFIELNDRIN